MAVFLNYPLFRADDDNGDPLVSGEVFTCAPGTTTNVTTYSDPNLTTPNTNPITLNSRGEADIYFQGTIKLRLEDSDNNLIWERDNITVEPEQQAEWINSESAVYVNSSTFTISGDQTSEYHVNRRIQMVGSTMGTIYGAIESSSYADPNTTITHTAVGSDATLSTVRTGIISATNTSSPFARQVGTITTGTVSSSEDFTIVNNLGTDNVDVFLMAQGSVNNNEGEWYANVLLPDERGLLFIGATAAPPTFGGDLLTAPSSGNIAGRINNTGSNQVFNIYYTIISRI